MRSLDWPFFDWHGLTSAVHYHQDQNSTLTVRAIRRVTRSRRRRSPQKILACPVISGFKKRELFSISVVIVTLFGATALRVRVVGAVPCACAMALELALALELELTCAAVAMDVTLP